MTPSPPRPAGRETAGRELDARVAEEVMGWERPTRLYQPWDKSPVEHPGCCLCTPHDLPHFSTDIAAAFLVVARVQSLHPGWRFSLLGGDTSFVMMRRRLEIEVDYGRRESFGWHAEFFGHDDPAQNSGQRHASEHADTAPLAICLASLAARRTPGDR